MTGRISWLKLLVLVVMSVLGFSTSSMVLIVYYTLKQHQVCPLIQGPGISLDCYAVLSSSYSQVFGIPLELFAAGYFLVNLLLVYLIAFGSESLFRIALKTLFCWRFIGIILVPYLVFIELYLVRAICIYCTLMHIAIVADFIIISYLLFYKKVTEKRH